MCFSKIHQSQRHKGQDWQEVEVDVVPQAGALPSFAAENTVQGEEASDIGLNIALSYRL